MILGEEGAHIVIAAGPDGLVSAVNLSEVVAKMLDRGATLDLIRERLDRLSLAIAPFDEARARAAGALRDATRRSNVSFADRACLSLGIETGLPVLTGDREWATLELGIDIRLIR